MKTKNKSILIALFLSAAIIIVSTSVHAQCNPSAYIKNQSDLLESAYKAGHYDDFDDVYVSLVNDQLYTTDQELDNEKTYTICVVTDPGVKALALQLNNDQGRKIDFIQTMSSPERNILKYGFKVPYEGTYQVQVKVITTSAAAQCVHIIILEYDPKEDN